MFGGNWVTQKSGKVKADQSKGMIKRKYMILLLTSIFIVVLDQITKSAITNRFRLGETVPVIHNYFNITYVQNKGAAFGIFSQASPEFRVPFFVLVPLFALGLMAFIFRRISDRDVKTSIALSLVISGAVGNLIDRFSLGYVVDFLDFHWQWGYHFPSFNVADSAICVGVGLILLDLFLQNPDD